MFRKFFFLIFPLLIAATPLFAQDDFIYENQVWIGYITNSRISNRVSIWNDVHYVPQSFLILRTGGTYFLKFSEKIKGNTTVGVAKLWLYSREDLTPTRNEFRPWGQTTASLNIKKFNISTRFRYDARFKQDIENNTLKNSYTFNWRFRYFLMLKYVLKQHSEKQWQWYAYSFNEILYDAGKNVKNGFVLNQNRFTIGLGYKYQNLAVQVGYLNMIKNLPAQNTKVLANTAMLMIFHSFDFRKNAKR